MPAGALLAGVVEQPLRDVLPDRVAAIQSDCIGHLDFHGPLAATTRDAQNVALNLGKMSQSLLGSGRGDARVFQDRFPIFRWEWLSLSETLIRLVREVESRNTFVS